MYDVINQSDQASHGSHDKLRPTPKLGGGGVLPFTAFIPL